MDENKIPVTDLLPDANANPAQEPAEIKPVKPQPPEDPTRYGDWVSKGRCIDF